MISQSIKLLLLLLSLLMLQPVRAVLADTGPKPTMEFTFKQEMIDEPVTITSGVLFECKQPDCSDLWPLEELGPQGFTCEVDRCRALAYGFSPYHILEIHFSDGQTRRSNIFETAGFDSKYTVTVRPDDLLVEGQLSLTAFPRTGTIIVACICALMGLGLLAGLGIFLVRRSKKN